MAEIIDTCGNRQLSSAHILGKLEAGKKWLEWPKENILRRLVQSLIRTRTWSFRIVQGRALSEQPQLVKYFVSIIFEHFLVCILNVFCFSVVSSFPEMIKRKSSHPSSFLVWDVHRGSRLLPRGVYLSANIGFASPLFALLPIVIKSSHSKPASAGKS